MKIGYVLMCYGLDADGNEICGTALCGSKSYSKVYKEIRKIYERELKDLDYESGQQIYDYDNQIVVDYGGDGARYIIESIEII